MRTANIFYTLLFIGTFLVSGLASANNAPTANGTIPAQTVTVGGASLSLDVSTYFSDPDGDTLRYTLDFSDSTTADASITGSTVTITGAAAGTTTVTVTATDTGGLTASQAFTLTVNPQPNQAPGTVGTIPDQTVIIGGTSVSVDVSGYFSDPDADALTYTASSSDTAKATVSVSSATVSITAVAAGTATITVTATDPGSLNATQTISVTVSEPNRSPVAVGTIPDQSVDIADDGTAQPPAGTSVSVDVSSYFSDPDGDPLSYAFTFSDSSKMNATVSGSTVTFVGVAAGDVTVTTTATDTGELSATQTFILTVVQPNRAPTKSSKADIPKQYTDSTTPVSVTGINTYFTDPDGDALTYTAASSDTTVATASVSGTTVTVSRVAAASDGLVTVTVTATDPGGLSATRTFTVRVDPIYQPADTVPGLSSAELSLLKGLLTYNTLIINELHNGAVDTTDWLEIRNVSDAAISLNMWQLTIRTGETPVVITFPADTVIPAGEVLLLVNAESSLPDLTGVSIMSVVSETFALPQHGFSLILRSPGAFGDLVSNYAVGEVERPEALPPLTAGMVWDRSQLNVPGYLAEAWTASTSADGLGTPGYQDDRAASVDLNADGVVNILDLVLVAGQIGQPATDNIADVNADGVVNILDLVLVASEL